MSDAVQGPAVPVSNPGALLGEGPVWDPEAGLLYWLDIKRSTLHRMNIASGTTDALPLAEPVSCMARRKEGVGFVAALPGGFAYLDAANGAIERVARVADEPDHNRFNDGKCDAAGNFWAGSMDNQERQASGWLYRLTPDLRCKRMDGPYTVTNGPAFSPDGRCLYHTDTFARTIYAFDVDHGVIVNKRVFVQFAASELGFPDGMTVDAEGYVWVAHWGGSRISRFAPDGALDAEVMLPVSQVTSCVFGGVDLSVLYVTTAAVGLTTQQQAQEPFAGALFEINTRVRGLPCNTFAG